MKAILFDYDGVLVDSMEHNYTAWKRSFNSFGVNLEREDYFPLEGAQLRQVADSISKKYNKKLDPEKIISLKEKFFKETYRFALYSGVEELIMVLKEKQVPMAIVSAARRERMLSTTPLSFLKNFDSIITGDKTEKGKPHPEPYLKAMSELKVSPIESIVVENAPLGVKSAKQAGAYCIAVCSTMDKKFLLEADEIINSFKELKELEKIKNIFH
ncbi:MAG: HAD family phosphatase [Nanoarchaeota archaeon]